MFNTNIAKTLIVVYKDELLANQIKKLVETKDDTVDGNAIGTTDNTVKIISWNEKVWISQKKAGVIDEKVLFIGDIKGVDKLIPVLDIKFDKYGVKYGWAGKQAAIFIDDKVLNDGDLYAEFLEEIAKMPLPEVIKQGNAPLDTTKIDDGFEKIKIKNDKIPDKFKSVFNRGVESVSSASNKVAVSAHNTLKDKPTVRKQMLFYGIINLYNNDLESFMNL